jgi:hypothetical protein
MMTRPFEQLNEEVAEVSPVMSESRPQGEKLSEAELTQVAGGNDTWGVVPGTSPEMIGSSASTNNHIVAPGTVQGAWIGPTGIDPEGRGPNTQR